MKMDDLKGWLKVHEGLKLKPYRCTSNKLSIGYGRNLEDKGLTKEEADYLLSNDIEECKRHLSVYKWYLDQPESVQCALINMCFMGIKRLLGFKKMIAALERKDYTKAALEALDSKWSGQVGKRAQDIALIISMGKSE